MRLKVFLWLLLSLSLSNALWAEDSVIRIGVLSHRGNETTYKMWSPTADYLSASVPLHRFEVVPLDFDEVDSAVQYGQVDFVLVNPGIYVTWRCVIGSLVLLRSIIWWGG